MIKHVIFDLSEVLLTGVKETGINLGKNHGVKTDPAHAGVSGTLNPLMVPAVWPFFHGEISEDKYIAEVLRIYPQFGTHHRLKGHIRTNFKEIKGMRDVVNSVRDAGYNLALLSVHGREWIEYCNMIYDIDILFDVVAYSYMEKVCKPKPEAFLKLLKRLETVPEECLFIDDAKTNVAAAEALGIKGLVFTRPEALETELSKALTNYQPAL